MTDEELEAWVERTRARGGLGPKITDEATLRRIVTLAFAGQGGGGGPGPPGRRSGGPTAKQNPRPSTPHKRSTQPDANGQTRTGQDRKSVRGGGGRAPGR
jgi:hypothetical protein